jgi:hypothetical protein
MRILLPIGLALLLVGCTQTSTIPVSQDTFQITSNTAPVCGPAAAQRVAVRQAAVEVIRRGYDRFLILGGQAGANVVGYTPTTVQHIGGGAVVAYGGTPMVAHSQGLMVKMFRDNDPAASNALSARQTLGPRWQEIASKQQLTCFDD